MVHAGRAMPAWISKVRLRSSVALGAAAVASFSACSRDWSFLGEDGAAISSGGVGGVGGAGASASGAVGGTAGTGGAAGSGGAAGAPDSGDASMDVRHDAESDAGVGAVRRRLALGRSHSCALLGPLRTLHCWGDNGLGQLGLPPDSVDAAFPRSEVPLPTPNPFFERWDEVESISAARHSTCALWRFNSSDLVFCWGAQELGSLGNGLPDGAYAPAVPVKVNETPQAGVTGLFPAGGDVVSASFCLASSNDVYCWGNNSTFQLGSPADPDGEALSSAAAGSVSTGPHHGCALSSGVVRCWGLDDRAQLGTTLPASSCPPPLVGVPCSAEPISVTLPGLATDVTVGVEHSCAVVSGSVYCWGGNDRGALGHADVLGSCEPTEPCGFPPQKVEGITGVVVDVEAGDDVTCALTEEGRVWCWGSNQRGQTGRSFTSEHEATPAPVRTELAELEGVEELDLGQRHACARVESNDFIYCWGHNDAGQVGLAPSSVGPDLVPWASRVQFPGGL